MRIAAVVVTHDRPKLLAHVIAALQGQTRVPDAIIVVDNASAAPTRELLARVRDITVLRSAHNLGGAGGFALGLSTACKEGYDWIWLLDDDAVPRRDALHELVRAAAGPAAGAGAVCGTVWEFDALALAHRRHFDRRSGIERSLARRRYAGAPAPVDTASFVGFMVAAQAVAEVGLPEAALFIGYDDTDYSLRLGKAGWPVWLAPASVVDHLRNPQTRLRAAPFGARHYFNIRNRIAIVRRHASLPVLPALCAAALGMALCLCHADRWRPGSWRILWQAIADGYRDRLGDYPQTLQRLAEPPLPARSGKSPSA